MLTGFEFPVAGAAVDSWDRMRVAAVAVLDLFPSPLPGLESPEALKPHLARVAELLSSARSRESDAGARLLALLQRKHVLGLGWRLRLHPSPTAELPVSAPNEMSRCACVSAGARVANKVSLANA